MSTKDKYETVFGIRATVEIDFGVPAETYEEAVEIFKQKVLEDYNIELTDDQIDKEPLSLRDLFDTLDKNGYEDASNFLQLHLSEEDDE